MNHSLINTETRGANELYCSLLVVPYSRGLWSLPTDLSLPGKTRRCLCGKGCMEWVLSRAF